MKKKRFFCTIFIEGLKVTILTKDKLVKSNFLSACVGVRNCARGVCMGVLGVPGKLLNRFFYYMSLINHLEQQQQK